MPNTTAPPRLVSNPISHFCEKARWALDRAGLEYREEFHLPVFSGLAARRAVGTSTVPALVADDVRLGESNDIVRWVDAQLPASMRWLSIEGGEQSELDALVARFDLELGPHVRRWCFDQVLSERDLVLGFFEERGPAWERRALAWTYPLAAGFLKRALKITPESVGRSSQKIDACLADVEARLADGRRYLVGERLTAAWRCSWPRSRCPPSTPPTTSPTRACPRPIVGAATNCAPAPRANTHCGCTRSTERSASSGSLPSRTRRRSLRAPRSTSHG
jgi:glutathione S-transferase